MQVNWYNQWCEAKVIFFAIVRLHFNLPVAAISVQCWKYTCVSKEVHTLICSRKWIRVSLCYGVELAIIHTEAEGTTVLWGKHKWGLPFPQCGLDDTPASTFLTSCSSTSRAFGPARYSSGWRGLVVGDSKTMLCQARVMWPKWPSQMSAKGSSMEKYCSSLSLHSFGTWIVCCQSGLPLWSYAIECTVCVVSPDGVFWLWPISILGSEIQPISSVRVPIL